MHILVTGSNGYIGSVMVPMLIHEGFQITGLDSGLFDQCTLKEPPLNFSLLRKDVRDIVDSDLEGFDAVIHLAGLCNDPLGDLDPKLTYEINHQGTVRLAKCAKSCGVARFLYASSCSLYGAHDDSLLDESSPMRPLTPYGRSKVLAEEDLSKLAGPEFSPTFFRNATAYGFSPRQRFDLVVNNFVAWAISTGKILIKSDGTAWRPLVHIEDISRTFIAALRAPRFLVHNQAFNVGRTEESYQVRDLAQMVKEIIPESTVEYASDRKPDQRCYRVSCEKLTRTFPGLHIEWNVRRGIQELYMNLREMKTRTMNFEGPEFSRIEHMKLLLRQGHLGPDLRWKRQDHVAMRKPSEAACHVV